MAGEKTDDARSTIHEALTNFSVQLTHGDGEQLAASIDKLTDAIMQLIKPEDHFDDFRDLQDWE